MEAERTDQKSRENLHETFKPSCPIAKGTIRLSMNRQSHRGYEINAEVLQSVEKFKILT